MRNWVGMYRMYARGYGCWECLKNCYRNEGERGAETNNTDKNVLAEHNTDQNAPTERNSLLASPQRRYDDES